MTIDSATTDVNAIVKANPNNTTFCFRPGTYLLAGEIQAKPGDKFIGQPGVVFDGQNTVKRGIWGWGGYDQNTDVVIQGIHFTRFADRAIKMGYRWMVRDNEIDLSLIGAEINSHSTLDGNHIHHNTQYGIIGGGTDPLIINNEVNNNNTSNYCGGTCGGDAGGSKIVGSNAGVKGLVWRNNNVHDNIGMGIWSDGNVRGLYEGNTVTNNSDGGIFHELSWDAIIRNNFLKNNAINAAGRSCWWGSQIHVNTSANVEVYGNTVVALNGTNGICAIGSDRPDAVPPYPTGTTNYYAHDNIVYMNGTSFSGLSRAGGEDTSGSRFVHNTYHVTSLSTTFWVWTDGYKTWSQWQAYPQDATGSADTNLSTPYATACDINKDNATNALDVQLSVNQALGLASCTADINKDGQCNVIDTQRVVNAALGGQCTTSL